MYSKMQAAGAAGGNGWYDDMPSLLNTTSSPGSTSRSYVASIRSRAQVSEASDPGAFHPAEHQRTKAVRITHGDQFFGGEEDQGVRATHLCQRVDDAILEGLAPASWRSDG